MAEPLTLAGLGALRVVDLKDALKERNLPTDGKKAVLLERLTESMQAAGMEGGPSPFEGATDVDRSPASADGNGANLSQAEPMDEEEQGYQQADVNAVDGMDMAEATEGAETAEPEPDAIPVTMGVIVTGSAEWGMCEPVAPAAEAVPEAYADDVPSTVAENGSAGASAREDGMAEAETAQAGSEKADDTSALGSLVASMDSNAIGASENGTMESALVAAAGSASEKASGETEESITGAAVAIDVVAAAETADDVPAAVGDTPAAEATNAATSATEAEAAAVVPTVTLTPAPASNPDDIYAYEEEQERLSMLKGLHQPMRKWYNEDYAMNRARFGSFPMFWQDMATWPAMREAKKLYLIDAERKENPEHAAANDAAAAADAASSPAAMDTADAAGTTQDSAVGEAEKAASTNIDAAATDTAEGANAEAEEAEKKKKRKNRWGDARKSRFADNTEGEADAAPPTKTRKSRWSSDETAVAATGPAAVKGVIPGMPVDLSQEKVQETLVLQVRLQQANEKLATVDQDAIIRSQDPDRSPSPPPRYDSNGVRTNTRDVRMREALNKERTKVIEEMMKLNPMFTPPADFVKSKPHRKLYIPTDEYPGYNFIGLIIGPRGNTQKRMERETDCKIAIRGKGSVKEGARRGPTAVDADDELHVYISGETEDSVEKAAIEVGKLLRPLDDEQNEHKQKQLRELALINGTLREEDYCTICGEKGHRQFECPKRAQTRSVAVEVRCALCGDTSHPTRDCLLHKAQQKTGQPGHEASLDKEYLSFMAELGDGDGAVGGTQLGPRPNASASDSSVGGTSAASTGGGGTSGNASGSTSSKPAPITNHYVWTPPTPAVRPAAPVTAALPAGPTVPPISRHSSPYTSSGPAYAQNTQTRPTGAHKSPFFRGGTPGVGAGGAPLLPPPEAPPLPPVPPVPPAPVAAYVPPPPVPPPQPPTMLSSIGTSTATTTSTATSAPVAASPPLPSPPTGTYGYVPPPLPPSAGAYGQTNPYQHSVVGGAYGYGVPPPQPPGAPPAWGAGAVPVPPPQPPLLPPSTAYVPPSLPPVPPGAPPTWPPSFAQSGYVPPPLPPSGGETNGNNGRTDESASISSQFASGQPPLPPPPLPGQPPLPPG